MPEDSFEAYDGEAHTMGVTFADLGGAQEDEAALRDNRDAGGAASPGVFGRVRNWITAGASTLGISSNWRIAATLLAFVLLLIIGGFAVALWLFGKQRVADFIARHIA
nr:hypothetical protein [Bradyrhizobium diazoefficiens]